MLTSRLAWRMQRWEVAALIGGALLLAAAIGFVAWQTSVTLEGLDACYAEASGGPLSSSCRSLIEWGNVLTAVTPMLQVSAIVAPFVVGILLGAPLVAREIEKRTAPVAWSLSLSRARWLTLRALPLLIAAGVALLVLAQASEVLITATPPGELGFQHFAMHGPLVAVRGIAVFIIGVVVGLVLGRVLPAILVTGLVVILLIVGLTLARGALMRAEAVWLDPDQSSSLSGAQAWGVTIYDVGYVDETTGERLTFDEVYERFPEVFGPTGTGIAPGMSQVYLATPPALYPVFVAREIGALALVSVLVAGVGLWMLRSRRPDLG